jgi:rare lipoprotein A
VRINDRGPFARGRIIDLSLAAAQAVGMVGAGVDRVEVRVIGYQGRPGPQGSLWVQVASFADPTNAQALAGRMRGLYSRVRMIAVELAVGRRYRVLVGEFASEQQAEVAASRLEAQFDVEALVLREDT